VSDALGRQDKRRAWHDADGVSELPLFYGGYLHNPLKYYTLVEIVVDVTAGCLLWAPATQDFKEIRAMRRTNRFTLVEVLAVIVIIMILVAILMPTTNLVLTKAEVKRTKAAMKNVQIAVQQYKITYRHLPEVNTSGTGDRTIGDGWRGDNRRFISQLTGVSVSDTGNINDYGNKRDIQFLEPPQSTENVSDSIDPGYANVNDAYVDAWGRRFKYRLDSNYDGEISARDFEPFTDDSFVVNADIIIQSKGPNESTNDTNGTADDNVYSWEDE
jgi:type II secretory pathway pseudopilin PulG